MMRMGRGGGEVVRDEMDLTRVNHEVPYLLNELAS
jgi:hypothetical protein